MEASEFKATREQLILKRNRLIKGLHGRRETWAEFHEVCRQIAELDQQLGNHIGEERVLIWVRVPGRDLGGGRR